MSFDVKQQQNGAEQAPTRLPRGRHNLSPEVVLASQRERLLAAMLDSVAERGYERTTVPLVVAAAHVSRNAFYDLFDDKTDCFLALCDELSNEILEDIVVTGRSDWVEALRVGTERYLRWWQERPALSRTYFVEMPSAGTRALEQRDRQYARFRALFDQIALFAREQQPELPPLGALNTRVVVLSVTELVAEEIRRGRTDRLVELSADVLVVMVRLLADDKTAARAA